MRTAVAKIEGTWREIIESTERTVDSEISTLQSFDESLLNSTKLSEKELDVVLEKLGATEGITYPYVKTLVNVYERATGEVELTDGGHVVIHWNHISMNRRPYVDLLLKWFTTVYEKDLQNKSLMEDVVRSRYDITTEVKAIKALNYFIKEIKESLSFDTCLMLLDSRDIRLINKYGIKEGRLITPELLEAVKDL